ncbi:hypothetical protein YH62_19140 [Rhizobium sp. LC145]|nr:hypothetical protein YH62_19140 [Rhizobium sp. LC145]
MILSISSNRTFIRGAVMADILGHIWNLLSSNTRVFLIVLLSCLIFLVLFPEEATGNVLLTVRAATAVAGAGILVSVLDCLWKRFCAWLEWRGEREEGLKRALEEEQIALSSISHLLPEEREFLRTALTRADKAGLFRRWTGAYTSDNILDTGVPPVLPDMSASLI